MGARGGVGVTDFAALVVVIGLAAYRVARIIVAEDGPFDAFAKARAWLRVDKQDTWVRRGLACAACVSFWTSFVFSMVLTSYGAALWLIGWLAAACVAVVLMRKVA